MGDSQAEYDPICKPLLTIGLLWHCSMALRSPQIHRRSERRRTPRARPPQRRTERRHDGAGRRRLRRISAGIVWVAKARAGRRKPSLEVRPADRAAHAMAEQKCSSGCLAAPPPGAGLAPPRHRPLQAWNGAWSACEIAMHGGADGPRRTGLLGFRPIEEYADGRRPPAAAPPAPPGARLSSPARRPASGAWRRGGATASRRCPASPGCGRRASPRRAPGRRSTGRRAGSTLGSDHG